ncbi:MAG: helix-turn-helix domain-containing protein [Candidatus Thermoplasmatota archaeon]
MLKEVRFRYRHDGCWLQETTERHASIMLVASAVYMVGDEVHMNVTVHAPDAGTVAKAFAEWKKDSRIKKVQQLSDGPRGARFHVAYSSPHSIYVHILQHTPVALGAIRFSQGVEHYQITGESPDLQDLLKVLGEKGTVEVLSIREAQELEAEESAAGAGPTAGLTDKQIEALVLAHQEGYYQWPRVRSASDLAEHLGLSSSAFLDHLRHAEAKLIGSIMGDLAIREPGRIESVRGRAKAGKAGRDAKAKGKAKASKPVAAR